MLVVVSTKQVAEMGIYSHNAACWVETMEIVRTETTKMKLGEVAVLREQDSTCACHERVGRQGH